MSKEISSPKIGTVVKHTGWGFENDSNYPCDVLIVDGEYFVEGRISNFWSWRRVLEDGQLGDIERGYGYFEESDKKYKVETKIKQL